MTAATRFWTKVKQTEGCWLWLGCLTVKGYGSFSPASGVTTHAQRFSWELHFGSIPPGASVLHRCDVRNCVRPDHLFLGDNAANTRDMISKGRERHPAGEDHGRAKLSRALIARIQQLRSDGRTQQQIARQFGVHHSTVGRVLRGESWRHLRSGNAEVRV